MTRPKVPDLEDNGEHACPYTAEGTDRVVADAHHVGFDEGFDAGWDAGFDAGWDAGDAHGRAWEAGYREAIRDAKRDRKRARAGETFTVPQTEEEIAEYVHASQPSVLREP